MRRGYSSKLIFSSTGQLVAFGTGSDACTEHECGSTSLRKSLTTFYEDETSALMVLRKNAKPGFSLCRLIFGKSQVRYPNLIHSHRISKFPEGLQFVLKDGPVPEALLGFAQYDLSGDLAIRFEEGYSREDPDVTGAWDERSFAIRVRGRKYVDALTGFHTALRNGQVGFAGKFMKREHLGGVVLANLALLEEQEMAHIRKAQADIESSLRLSVRSEQANINKEMQRLAGRSAGYLWTVWADEQESDILYCLNPGYGVTAEYYGPYTREELLAWAKAGYGYPLRRRVQRAA